MSEQDTSIQQVRLIDIVRAELVELIATSKDLRERIDNAKTTTKQSYYKKKLRKNNLRVMEMLQAAERLKGREDTSGNIPSEASNEDD